MAISAHSRLGPLEPQGVLAAERQSNRSDQSAFGRGGSMSVRAVSFAGAHAASWLGAAEHTHSAAHRGQGTNAPLFGRPNVARSAIAAQSLPAVPASSPREIAGDDPELRAGSWIAGFAPQAATYAPAALATSGAQVANDAVLKPRRPSLAAALLARLDIVRELASLAPVLGRQEVAKPTAFRRPQLSASALGGVAARPAAARDMVDQETGAPGASASRTETIAGWRALRRFVESPLEPRVGDDLVRATRAPSSFSVAGTPVPAASARTPMPVVDRPAVTLSAVATEPSARLDDARREPAVVPERWVAAAYPMHSPLRADAGAPPSGHLPDAAPEIALRSALRSGGREVDPTLDETSSWQRIVRFVGGLALSSAAENRAPAHVRPAASTPGAQPVYVAGPVAAPAARAASSPDGGMLAGELGRRAAQLSPASERASMRLWGPSEPAAGEAAAGPARRGVDLRLDGAAAWLAGDEVASASTAVRPYDGRETSSFVSAAPSTEAATSWQRVVRFVEGLALPSSAQNRALEPVHHAASMPGVEPVYIAGPSATAVPAGLLVGELGRRATQLSPVAERASARIWGLGETAAVGAPAGPVRRGINLLLDGASAWLAGDAHATGGSVPVSAAERTQSLPPSSGTFVVTPSMRSSFGTEAPDAPAGRVERGFDAVATAAAVGSVAALLAFVDVQLGARVARAFSGTSAEGYGRERPMPFVALESHAVDHSGEPDNAGFDAGLGAARPFEQHPGDAAVPLILRSLVGTVDFANEQPGVVAQRASAPWQIPSLESMQLAAMGAPGRSDTPDATWRWSEPARASAAAARSATSVFVDWGDDRAAAGQEPGAHGYRTGAPAPAGLAAERFAAVRSLQAAALASEFLFGPAVVAAIPEGMQSNVLSRTDWALLSLFPSTSTAMEISHRPALAMPAVAALDTTSYRAMPGTQARQLEHASGARVEGSVGASIGRSTSSMARGAAEAPLESSRAAVAAAMPRTLIWGENGAGSRGATSYRLPDGRTPRGSWIQPHDGGTEAPTEELAPSLLAEMERGSSSAAPVVAPLWGQLRPAPPALGLVGSISAAAGGTMRGSGPAAAPLVGGYPASATSTAPVVAEARGQTQRSSTPALEFIAPFLEAARTRSSGSAEFAPGNARPPAAPARAADDSTRSLVTAVAASSAGTGSQNDRLNLADLTLISVLAGAEQVAASRGAAPQSSAAAKVDADPAAEIGGSDQAPMFGSFAIVVEQLAKAVAKKLEEYAQNASDRRNLNGGG